ncbi:MAG: hypothetical protein ABI131_05850 [Nostocoides sp.]
MSQLTATARVAGRPHSPARAPQRGALRVIRGTVDRPRGGVFATICLAALVSGFLAVLVLNTTMAKGAFVLDNLQGQSGRLSDTKEALQHSIDAQSAPAELAQRAMKLGMVPSSTAAFLDLSTGKILGVAKPAAKVPGFTVITSPVPVPPKVTLTPAKPTTTVTHKGTVTTTTVVTTKANGVVVTTVTTVDSATGTTTTTTRTTAPVTKPGATPTATPTTSPTATPTGTPTTTR